MLPIMNSGGSESWNSLASQHRRGPSWLIHPSSSKLRTSSARPSAGLEAGSSWPQKQNGHAGLRSALRAQNMIPLRSGVPSADVSTKLAYSSPPIPARLILPSGRLLLHRRRVASNQIGLFERGDIARFGVYAQQPPLTNRRGLNPCWRRWGWVDLLEASHV